MCGHSKRKNWDTFSQKKIGTLVANINRPKHPRLPSPSSSFTSHPSALCPDSCWNPRSRSEPPLASPDHATGRLPESQGRVPANTSPILCAPRCPTFQPDLRDPHRHRRAFPEVRRPVRTSQILLRILSSPTCSSWFAENGGGWL
jgi:hypothetical protein